MKKLVMVFLVLTLCLSIVSAFSLCDLFPFFCKDGGITGMVAIDEPCPSEGAHECADDGDTQLYCPADLEWQFSQYCSTTDRTCENGYCKAICGDGICGIYESYSNCAGISPIDCAIGSEGDYCSNNFDDDEDGSIDCDDSDCSSDSNCATCTDSDGGRDYYIKGVARGSKLSWGESEQTEFTDLCVDFSIGESGQVVGSCEAHGQCSVDEYYCQDDTIHYEYVNCPYGCSGGACVEEELTDCTEGTIPSSGCKCQGIEKTSGYCCYSYLLNKLMWTNVPCTQTCTSIGGVCCSGSSGDCDDWSNQWATDCQGYICCAGTCIGKIYHPETPTCSGQGGIICSSNQNCLGTRVGSGDSTRCCIGTCDPPLGNLTCSQQSKYICAADKECIGSIVSSSDSDRCCDGYCSSPANTSAYCGDGICNPTNNETASTCPIDCAASESNQTTTTTESDQVITNQTTSESDQITTDQILQQEQITIINEINEINEISALENGTSCPQGCFYGDKCLPIGTRSEINEINVFCNISGDFELQRTADGFCNNHYECRSNFCTDDKCIEQGFLMRIINWFKRLFGIMDDEGELNETALNQTTTNQTTTNQTSSNQTTTNQTTTNQTNQTF